MAELAEPIPATAPRAPQAAARLGWRARIGGWSALRRFVLVLFVLYVAKQGIFVLAFRPFTGHDEVAHYAYLRTVATEHRVPELLVDRLPDELYRYCPYVLNWDTCQPTDPRWLADPPNWWPYLGAGSHRVGMQYGANHPPLYYILMTPLYWLSDGESVVVQQYLLRLAAIPFGLLTVFFAYRTARALFPNDGFLAVTVPTFVAFQPQISYEAAMVNSDIVAIALYSWILYLLVVGVRDRFPARTCVLLGFALGLALLAKGTSLTAAPIIAGALVLGVGWRHVREWLTKGAIVAGVAAALAWPWFLFLWRTYGNLSGLDQVAELQWWNYWNRSKPGFFDLLFNRDFVVMRFHETWGYFGWRDIPLDTTLLWAIAVPMLLCVGGLVQYVVTARPGPDPAEPDPVLRPRRWQVTALLVLVATVAVAYLAVVQFGTRFMLTQARYYFPAVNAAALLLMLGLRTLVPRSAHTLTQGVVFAALLLLNVLIFTQYVIPHYRAS